MNLRRTFWLISLGFALNPFLTAAGLVTHEIGQWPAPPGSRSRSSYPSTGSDMVVRGDKAFVGVGASRNPGRLVIFDLAQGPNPVKLGQLELSPSNTLQSISVSGNIACVA